MKHFLLVIASAASVLAFAQPRRLAEITPSVSEGAIVPYLNPDFVEFKAFTWAWDHNECHVDSIDLSLSTDTIHLNWVNRRHPEFHMPVGGELRSQFGWRRYRYHYGVDLKLNRGDTVYAAFDGKIRYARYNYGGYGNLVVVRHYNGAETYYAHLSKFLVDTNDYVKAGTPIGLGGSTGRSTGPHLHFEIRYLGNAINPTDIINFETGELVNEDMDIHSDVFKYKKEMRERKYHRVRSGETLSAIARRYHTSVNSICRLNGIRSTDIIRIGQNLRVR
ncbi:M23 family metallopeptidase [Phaeocystidibacter luteus]|uniref:Peptidoglycan DD-metalloendopeptidase family protein n=1 Tax=Phaeocystidibacter luteus TaxID=911197 RepID=A0A6N6RL67_9FLAO|nr:M23 family metallopeptidase [Phaeocystidibacter luteus]KAB2813792.1 peptidoglycan DD-metalloendopeptidase family protein [Phaeocystidibacter luteus]